MVGLLKTTGLVGLAYLSIVKAEPGIKKLEDRVRGGYLEEVILQAENELGLARKVIQWKPWEPLVEKPPANQWKWTM
ncbi:NADH dehydrogenase [ubiquinone] 1 alpha subcomplex subunit 5-like [Enhydra lutris kenyoni]|uniref:NADH dehydrogenase [ubiquinone] 1 alpha subcomplex subunit 5 n=1 Tax=Enhydra lutris kenyoni TaxID=391180 RepID=A0A2Y9KEI4_ENHLU|nr:NADH dehydrogenase [ubiquinone] 1 alpha subcomplex subunit 5-like [Enhydra lutris kenyoni]